MAPELGLNQKSETTSPQSITYILKYGNRGWTSHMNNRSAQLVVNRAISLTTNVNSSKKKFWKDFCDAMDECCDRFCPITSKRKRPWHEHRQEDEIGNARDLLQQRAVEKPWDLDWYWKILIVSLLEWKKKPSLRLLQKIHIHLSQVRRWMMLTVFQEIGGTKKLLLREPVFGRTNRLVEWDQYWLYLLNADKIIAEWENSKVDVTNHFERAYIVGRHDVRYVLDLQKIKFFQNESTITIPITGDLNLTPYEKLDCKAKDTYEWDSSRLRARFHERQREPWDPYDFIRVPVFHNPLKKKEKGKEKVKENSPGDPPFIFGTNSSSSSDNEHKPLDILLASDRVCETLELLSDVWNDPTIRIIHLNAPPGSGKEKITETIYKFRRFQGQYRCVALSPRNPEKNELILFGVPIGISSSTPDERLDTASSDKSGRIRPVPKEGQGGARGKMCLEGFVRQTEHGVLVLDEIDKVEPATRTILLRLLENEEFVIPGINQVYPVKKKTPLYVFLTSMSIEKIYNERGPSDFWQRIPFIIEMKHAFDIDDSQERENVLQQYCWLFWNQHICSFIEGFEDRTELVIAVPPDEEQVGPQDGRFILEYLRSVCKLLRSKALTYCICAALARELNTRYKRISVRHVRSIVQRCVFKFVQWIMYSRTYGVPAQTLLTNEYHKIRQTFETIIYNGRYEEIFERKEPNEALKRTIETIAKSSIERRVDYPG